MVKWSQVPERDSLSGRVLTSDLRLLGFDFLCVSDFPIIEPTISCSALELVGIAAGIRRDSQPFCGEGAYGQSPGERTGLRGERASPSLHLMVTGLGQSYEILRVD